MTILPFHPQTLRVAQYYIEEGKLVSFTTETVYALAADATNDTAVARICAAKKRDSNKPLSLLVKDVFQIRALCEMHTQAEMLLAAFAPGPLTLILKLKPGHGLSSLVNPGMDTIGVRIPDHPIAQSVLWAMPVPLVGTSANLSGQADALCAEEAAAYLGDTVSLVIDGGTSRLGVASTVVDVSQGNIRIVREGSISRRQLEEVLTGITAGAGTGIIS